MNCLNCNGHNLVKFQDLGQQPNGNVFPSKHELEHEISYPLVMCVCSECWQVQLESFPRVEGMFENHPYITGLNRPVVEHFENLAKTICDRFNIKPNSLVIDIGANDGTLLTKFRSLGMRVLGIDPNEITNKIAAKNGVTVFKSFWNYRSACILKSLNISPDIITATAVFYHIADMHDFVKGLNHLMNDNTVFCVQCIYLKEIIEKLQFDHFYHEHTMIHAIGPLKRIFTEHGFKIIDVDFYPIHGGSFVLYVSKINSVYESSPDIHDVLLEEQKAGLYVIDTYHAFRDKVLELKINLLKLLEQVRLQNETVIALGAALKGNTLLNYYGIGPNLVKCIVDVNEFKIGRYSPGTHIPIVSESDVIVEPEYYLLLAWNYTDFFINKYRVFLEQGGRFIIPHPQVRVISLESLNEVIPPQMF